jgi:Carboxypeptidase regulatory-like domain
MRRMLSTSWMALAIVMGVIATAWGQSGTATLQGKVTDDQKAAIPGATVTLSNAGTGFERVTTTAEGGTYTFVSVPPGSYKLTVELTSFRTAVHDNVILQVDSTTQQDVALQVGGFAEALQVIAETPTVNTSDASMGNVISGTQIRELPLEARNVAGLLSLQAGVTFVPGNNAVRLRQRYSSGPLECDPRRHRCQRRPEPERLHVGAPRHARFGPGVPCQHEQLQR